jgi:hypothetical protein
LDKQAKKNKKENPSPNAAPTATGELPRTGVPLLPVSLLGGLLTASGLILRRKGN